MFEVILLLLIVLLIAAFAFLPWGGTSKSSQYSDAACDSCSNSELSVSEGSTGTQNFLSHLQNEIEAALFPRPTDSILQRHYDTLVSSELENRLAAMPDS